MLIRSASSGPDDDRLARDGRRGLVPSRELVASRRDVPDSERPGRLGFREERRIHHVDERAHRRVDVAEQIDRSGAIELSAVRQSRGADTRVEIVGRVSEKTL